jgi:NAD(P)H-dependent FMN reductase
MNILIVGTSLDPESKSQQLARLVLSLSREKGHTADLLDLRHFKLPFAGEDGSFDAESVMRLKEKMMGYHKFIFCVPIYNYNVSASAKNFIELVGDKWLENSTIGFICAASGQSSYMSVMSFANSLQLDFRVWVVPRFVYSVSSDWHNGELKNGKVKERIEGLLEGLVSGPK